VARAAAAAHLLLQQLQAVAPVADHLLHPLQPQLASEIL
jgi:hypothetical protein